MADLGLQWYLGEFGLSYRILQAPQGWFDILAGFRFTYLGNQMGLQANQANINTASTDLVNLFAQQVTTPGSNLNTLIQQTIQSRLGSLADLNPGPPVPPLAGREPGRIRDLVRGLIQSRQPELVAAIRAGDQARVNQLKVELANAIANGLTSRLSQSFSLYENWFDPFMGVRGRYKFYNPSYLTAEGDVGALESALRLPGKPMLQLDAKSLGTSFPRLAIGFSIWTTTPPASSIRSRCMARRSPLDSSFRNRA
jgi:hypothetical protein